VSWAVTNLTVSFGLDLAGFIIFYSAAVAAAVLVVTTLYVYTTSNNISSEATAVVEKQVPGPNQEHRKEGFERCSSDVILPKHDEDEDSGVDGTAAKTGGTKEQQLDVVTPEDTPQMHALLGKVIGTAYGAAFCLALLTMASGQAVVDGLVFLFFKGLGSSYTIMGVTVVLTVLF
jgi:hypothetical protein